MAWRFTKADPHVRHAQVAVENSSICRLLMCVHTDRLYTKSKRPQNLEAAIRR